jgi:hypothetical protein
MKNIFSGIVTAAVFFTACNSGNNVSNENGNKNTDTAGPAILADNQAAKNTASVNGIVAGYLQVKNALANDNGKDAANSSNAIISAVTAIDTTAFAPQQKTIWNDVKDDIKEHAEHIGANGDKIEHQREHFEMLSKDMYDLVKTFGGGQTLYQDYCPMYNDNKGATWLRETKEIRNPYLGQKMPTCGTVKEEIK